MGGRKVKLAFIVKDSTRKATYRKRRMGFMKKLDELTTLCGVDACAVMYKPDDHAPEVWPSPQKAEEVLIKYMQTPEFERSKKMQTHESYLRDEISKASDKLNKITNENRKEKMVIQMLQSLESGVVPQNLSPVENDDFNKVIDMELKKVEKKIAEMTVDERTQSQETVVGPEMLAGGASMIDNGI